VKVGLFLVVVLLVVGIALLYYNTTKPATVVYANTTVQGDKRKSLGASFMGTGVNFAW
jgi:hypothetical protein